MRHTRIVKLKEKRERRRKQRIKWNLWFSPTPSSHTVCLRAKRMPPCVFSIHFFSLSDFFFIFRFSPLFATNGAQFNTTQNANRIKYINLTQDNMNDGSFLLLPSFWLLTSLSLSVSVCLPLPHPRSFPLSLSHSIFCERIGTCHCSMLRPSTFLAIGWLWRIRFVEHPQQVVQNVRHRTRKSKIICCRF